MGDATKKYAGNNPVQICHRSRAGVERFQPGASSASSVLRQPGASSCCSCLLQPGASSSCGATRFQPGASSGWTVLFQPGASSATGATRFQPGASSVTAVGTTARFQGGASSAIGVTVSRFQGGASSAIGVTVSRFQGGASSAIGVATSLICSARVKNRTSEWAYEIPPTPLFGDPLPEQEQGSCRSVEHLRERFSHRKQRMRLQGVSHGRRQQQRQEPESRRACWA